MNLSQIYAYGIVVALTVCLITVGLDLRRSKRKLKMCLECWEFQPIERKCLKHKKKAEPTQLACEDFISSVE